MSTHETATASPTAGHRPGWRQTLSDPTLVAIAAYAAVAMVAAVGAYMAIFTTFATYDDEGTLLVTLQAFANGDVLYRDIYSPYGPFYYELFGGLFALTGHAVTNDASRSIVIVLWVATSFLFGLATQRLTGRLALGVAGMCVAFSALFVLANEPMHPQVLCVALLGLFTLLAVFGPGRRPLWLGAAGGALLAALVLTKLNLGIFAVAATALAAVLTIEPLRRRRWLLWPVVAAAVAMPALVAARDLELGWVREMVLFETFSMLAVVVAAWPLGSFRKERVDDGGAWRWLWGAVAGFAVASVAIVAAILLTGPSLSDMYAGVVTEAMRVRDVVLGQFPLTPAAVDWGLAAVAAAVVVVLSRSDERGEPSLWPGLLRAAAGLAIWLTVARITPLSIGPSAGNQVALPAVLTWIAVVPPAGLAETQYKRFLRVLFASLAVAETLQVYPVPGSQVGIASLVYVPVGALCLGDALVSLQRWAQRRGGLQLRRFAVVAAVATVALAADMALNTVVKAAVNGSFTYRERQSLPLPGAGQLRIPPEEAETYVRLVNLLHQHRCTDFIGYPNINSLYLWSGIEPPAPDAPGAWIEALDDQRQQRIVDQLRASPRPCAIRSDQRAGLWLGGDPVPDSPLVNYVLEDFHPVAEFGEFQFMLPDKPEE